MKLSDIRAAIKAKNDSLNIAPPVPGEPVPVKPQVVKSSTKKSNSVQNITSEAAATSPQPAKRQSSKKESKSKSSTSTVNTPDEDIETIVGKYLKPQQDYAVIPHTTKPTLLKGGAEKLATIFGFTTSCSIVNRIEHFDYDNPATSFVQYEAKVIVYNCDGTAVSEGYGSCNSSESKFLKQPFANRINTVLKISKKRAYVDAILTATCASSVFTQDMEDIVNFQDSVK